MTMTELLTIVRQSALIHPDWDVQEHVDYLKAETNINLEIIDELRPAIIHAIVDTRLG